MIDRALKIDPRNPSFWGSKLWVLYQAGKIDDISATGERALDAAGDDVNLQVMVANFFVDVEIDRVDRARDLLRDVQPSALSNELGRLRLAETLLMIGDNVRALALLHSIDLKPACGLTAYRTIFSAFACRQIGRSITTLRRVTPELLARIWKTARPVRGDGSQMGPFKHQLERQRRTRPNCRLKTPGARQARVDDAD